MRNIKHNHLSHGLLYDALCQQVMSSGHVAKQVAQHGMHEQGNALCEAQACHRNLSVQTKCSFLTLHNDAKLSFASVTCLERQ